MPPRLSPENFYTYLPITEELRHGSFHVTGAGQFSTRPGTTYPPPAHPSLYHFRWEEGRTLPEFSLMLVSASQGVFETRETASVLFTGTVVILLFPGVWHRYRPIPQTGWSEKWVHFNGEFAHELLARGVISPERPFPLPIDIGLVDTLLDRLVAAVRRDPTTNSLHLSLLALGVLGAALEPASLAPASKASDSQEPGDPIVTAATSYIWTRSHGVLSASEVADAIGVTRRSLERHMMKFTGRSVLDAIIDCRYLRAERLLRETDLKINAVASLSGFGSEENMRHLFVERAHCPPAAYRSRHHLARTASDRSANG